MTCMTEISAPPKTNRPSKRPFRITLLVIFLFLVGIAGLYRSGWYLLHRADALSLIPPFQFWYLLNSGLPAALFCPAVGVWVWQRKPESRKWFMILFVLGTAQYWLEKCFITVNPISKINWPFALILNLLLASLNTAILYSSPGETYFKGEQL